MNKYRSIAGCAGSVVSAVLIAAVAVGCLTPPPISEMMKKQTGKVESASTLPLPSTKPLGLTRRAKTERGAPSSMRASPRRTCRSAKTPSFENSGGCFDDETPQVAPFS